MVWFIKVAVWSSASCRRESLASASFVLHVIVGHTVAAESDFLYFLSTFSYSYPDATRLDDSDWRWTPVSSTSEQQNCRFLWCCTRCFSVAHHYNYYCDDGGRSSSVRNTDAKDFCLLGRIFNTWYIIRCDTLVPLVCCRPLSLYLRGDHGNDSRVYVIDKVGSLVLRILCVFFGSRLVPGISRLWNSSWSETQRQAALRGFVALFYSHR